ncbi:TPA: hypothetical protein DCW38_08505 [candidate division WOR-3 bacterium]|uniref:Bacterial surface antigen (D15) domain-containing protein n=1 Tax=candidate division WOR-3 bacterium TaxID=2052148 RepID=A0A350HCD4_UNCW3|nr:hypothetical protein [candidate division WOR-3 bacterium]
MRKGMIFLLLILTAAAIFPEVVRTVEKVIPTFTKDDFVIAQVSFKAGDAIGAEDVKESILNLKKTDLFGLVEIETVKVDSGADIRLNNDSLSRSCDYDTVEVRLITKEMLALLPSFGYSTSSPYYITLGAYFGNLWRIRHKIEFFFTFLQVQEFAMEYTIPSVYSRKYNGIFRGAINQKARGLLDIFEYHKTANLGVGYSFNPKFIPLFTIGYDRVNFKDDSVSFSYLDNDSIGYDEFAFFVVKLTTDHRDDPYFPTKGFYSETSFRKNINWWSTPINHSRFIGEYRLFMPFITGTFAFRNRFTLSSGKLAYYNNSEPENLENRAIPEKDIVAFNRYSGNLELRYPLPFKYTLEYPILGTISINFITTLFADWTLTDSLMSDMSLFDFESYKWGFGAGFLVYSELFNAVGIEVGYAPKNGTTDILENLKYNLLLLSWNF